MRLANMLKPKYIINDLRSMTKESAVNELLELLKQDHAGINIEAIKRVIQDREKIENTSYGHGFAFPHARTDEVDDMYILLGVAKEGLEGETSDGVPLSVIVLLLTPSHISKLYLQTLSAFAAFARDAGNLGKIISASSKSDIIHVFWESGVKVEKELTVKDVMRREFTTVTPENTLKDVANLMFKFKISALAVVDDSGVLLGQITDKELIQAALPDYKSLISNLNYSMDIEPFEELLKKEDLIKVAEIYHPEFEVVAMNTPIVEVAAMMIFKDLRRVFVTEENRLVGILLRKDLVTNIIRG